MQPLGYDHLVYVKARWGFVESAAPEGDAAPYPRTRKPSMYLYPNESGTKIMIPRDVTVPRGVRVETPTPGTPKYIFIPSQYNALLLKPLRSHSRPVLCVYVLIVR